MPIIRFRCNKCGEEFEDFRNIKDKEETGGCISCGCAEIKRVEVMNVGCDCGCGCSEVPGDHSPGGCC